LFRFLFSQGKDARGALVFMARTAETAERYEDMCKVRTETRPDALLLRCVRLPRACMHLLLLFCSFLFLSRKAHSITHCCAVHAVHDRIFGSARHNPFVCRD